jgi:hypothetical protein
MTSRVRVDLESPHAALAARLGETDAAVFGLATRGPHGHAAEGLGDLRGRRIGARAGEQRLHLERRRRALLDRLLHELDRQHETGTRARVVEEMPS